MNSFDLVAKLAKGRVFDLRKSHYSFIKTSYISEEFVVYEVESLKNFQSESFEKGKVTKSKNSTVIRIRPLPTEDIHIKLLFDLFDCRRAINTKKCLSLLTFYDQGIFEYSNNFYYAVRYDEPLRDLNIWITEDYLGLPIDLIDLYRIASNCLEAFDYLEDNGYVLTQFDEKNIYATSISENRANFIKIMFKGYQTTSFKTNLTLERLKFYPPETETSDIYRSYVFSLGLIIIWAIFQTNKIFSFPIDIYSNPNTISTLITRAVDLIFKDSISPLKSYKEPFRNFLESCLQIDIENRESPKQLLSSEWICESYKFDFEDYKKERDEYHKLSKQRKGKELDNLW